MRTGARPRTAAAAATVALLALMTACSSSPAPAPSSSSMSPSPTATSSSAVPSPSTTSPTASPTPTLTGAATTPVTRPPGDGGFGYLTAARLAGHPGYDRFVLQFKERVPGYEVQYVDRPVVADPSGETVKVAGDHVLAIRLVPSSGFDMSTDPAGPSYTGPTRITGSGTSVVREAVMTGDFEGVLQWVLGVDGERPFVVTELSSPPRLVIDVAAG